MALQMSFHVCMSLSSYSKAFSVTLLSAIFTFCFQGIGAHYSAKQLDHEVLNYRLHTFTENTKSTYKTHLDSYYRFYLFLNIPAAPASARNIYFHAAF